MQKKDNNSESQNQSVEKEHQNSQTFFISLGMIASLFAVFGVILTLLGYGIVLGIATTLHLDPGTLQTSSFDYISVSWVGLLMIFAKFNFWETIFSSFTEYKWLIVTPFLISIFFIIRDLNKLGKLNSAKIYAKEKIKGTNDCLKKLADNWVLSTTVIKSIIKGFSFPLLLIMAMSLGLVICVVGYFIVIMIPTFGTVLGQSYVKEAIDKNALCRPIVAMTDKQSPSNLKNSQQQQKAEDKKDYVSCARVVTWGNEENKRDQEIARGRVIMSNSEFILLYQAGVGAIRIALKDQSTKIEPVTELDPPSKQHQVRVSTKKK